jgi:chromosome segregation ATPase
MIFKRRRDGLVVLAGYVHFLKKRVLSMAKTNADLLLSIANAKQALADETARAAAASSASQATISSLQSQNASQAQQITDLQTQNAALQTALDDANDATSEVADVDGITAGLQAQFPTAVSQ